MGLILFNPIFCYILSVINIIGFTISKLKLLIYYFKFHAIIKTSPKIPADLSFIYEKLSVITYDIFDRKFLAIIFFKIATFTFKICII